jgi:ABC-type uncharacterized transport system permease subunit
VLRCAPVIVPILFGVTALAYLVASGLFLAFLLRGGEALGRAALGALGAGTISHLVFLVAPALSAAPVLALDIRESLAVGSLLVSLAFLVTTLTPRAPSTRLSVLGAFITPVTLVFFLGAGLHRNVTSVPEGVRSALLPVHVGVNVLGVVAFALAFGVAVAYVVQERQLRQKRIGGMLSRLPPLDVLDALGFRFIAIGFPLFTLGVVSGALWAVRLDPDAPALSTSQLVGLLAWLTFAAVLGLRVGAGWRGRRAAYGTMAGFLCTCLLLLGYVFRDGSGVGS